MPKLCGLDLDDLIFGAGRRTRQVGRLQPEDVKLYGFAGRR